MIRVVGPSGLEDQGSYPKSIDWIDFVIFQPNLIQILGAAHGRVNGVELLGSVPKAKKKDFPCDQRPILSFFNCIYFDWK